MIRSGCQIRGLSTSRNCVRQGCLSVHVGPCHNRGYDAVDGRCGLLSEVSQARPYDPLRIHHPRQHLNHWPTSSHGRVTPSRSSTISNAYGLEPKFEVVGNVCSLLNVSLPASWPLYTRRGTVVSVRGQIENVFCHRDYGKADVDRSLLHSLCYYKIPSLRPYELVSESRTSTKKLPLPDRGVYE